MTAMTEPAPEGFRIPVGGAIDDEQFARRHSIVVGVLAAHFPVLFAIGVLNGYAVWHAALESVPVLAFAAFARSGRTRLLGSIPSCLGLVYAAATLVHFTGGIVESHFHWFVVLPLASLYIDIRPFVAAVVAIAGHHIVVGFLDPTLVFEHERGQENPLLWTAIHVVFVVMLIGALAVNWVTLELQSRVAARQADELQRHVEQQEALADEQTALAHEQAEMARHAEQLAEQSEALLREQRARADDVARRCQTLDAASEEVRSTVDDTASAIEDMRSSVDSVGAVVASVSAQAEQAAAGAEATTTSVHELTDLSEEIDTMVAFITEIAERTNLLALNATIEAARAGAAGKGFAVVASEVKDLASSTTEAASKIGAITDQIRSGMEASVAGVSSMSDLIESIGALQGDLDTQMTAQQVQVDRVRSNAATVSGRMETMRDEIGHLNQVMRDDSGAPSTLADALELRPSS